MLWLIISPIDRKYGLLGLTQVMALEWGPRGVQVNAVSPTVVLTEMGRVAWAGEPGEVMKQEIPLRRFALPEEVAAATLFSRQRCRRYDYRRQSDRGWRLYNSLIAKSPPRGAYMDLSSRGRANKLRARSRYDDDTTAAGRRADRFSLSRVVFRRWGHGRSSKEQRAALKFPRRRSYVSAGTRSTLRSSCYSLFFSV